MFGVFDVLLAQIWSNTDRAVSIQKPEKLEIPPKASNSVIFPHRGGNARPIILRLNRTHYRGFFWIMCCFSISNLRRRSSNLRTVRVILVYARMHQSTPPSSLSEILIAWALYALRPRDSGRDVEMCDRSDNSIDLKRHTFKVGYRRYAVGAVRLTLRKPITEEIPGNVPTINDYPFGRRLISNRNLVYC